MDRSSDLDKLFALLPGDVRDWIEKQAPLDDLIEIVFDAGREPQAWFRQNETNCLSVMEDRIVQELEVRQLLEKCKGGQSNHRYAVKDTLHRVSALFDKQGYAYALTLRVGKNVEFCAGTIYDLMKDNKSVLLIGPPGSGKTSKLRDLCRFLSTDRLKRVMIVDGTNEIAGESAVPHQSVGLARRIMVNDKREQFRHMLEAVENHTPDVVVVDELSIKEDAWACRSVAERGVSLLATAHGDDFESVLNNNALSVLFGNVRSVTLGDREATRRRSNKTALEREFKPVFDVVVVLVSFDLVAVYTQVETAVDMILNGGTVKPEIRQSTGVDTYTVLHQAKYVARTSQIEESTPQRQDDRRQYKHRKNRS